MRARPRPHRVDGTPAGVVRAGNRLRLTIGTADTPSTPTPLPDLGRELGGTITILHDAQHPSSVLLPFAP